MGVCLRYFSNRDDALAALNHGFLKIFKNLESYDSKYDFEGWIYRIVQRTAIDQVRKQLRHESKLPTNELNDEMGSSPEIIKILYAQDLIKILHRLPPTTKIAFNLFAIEGFSHAEVA